MANLELSSGELVKIIKPHLPDEVKNLKGTDSGFIFDFKIDHGIPLIPKSIPLKIEYHSFDTTDLIFELTVNSESNILNRAAGKIIKLLSSQLEDILPEGIVIQESFIYGDISEQFAESELEPKIVHAQFEDKTFYLEFKC
ncbi:MAG: hypothetical protein KDC90_11915 [Ignavibacteriae bacterium]|nr:hypothetical protein [Ignavibacteriota bacterium]